MLAVRHPALLLQVQAAFPLVDLRVERLVVGQRAVVRQAGHQQVVVRLQLLRVPLLQAYRRAIFLVHPRRLQAIDASEAYPRHLGHRLEGHRVDRAGHRVDLEGHHRAGHLGADPEAVLLPS